MKEIGDGWGDLRELTEDGIAADRDVRKQFWLLVRVRNALCRISAKEGVGTAEDSMLSLVGLINLFRKAPLGSKGSKLTYY
jgi:hypothetical protein